MYWFMRDVLPTLSKRGGKERLQKRKEVIQTNPLSPRTRIFKTAFFFVAIGEGKLNKGWKESRDEKRAMFSGQKGLSAIYQAQQSTTHIEKAYQSKSSR